jgi:hypothetical protein
MSPLIGENPNQSGPIRQLVGLTSTTADRRGRENRDRVSEADLILSTVQIAA